MIPVWLVWYAGVSVVTFAAYALDKSAAQNNRRRTPEATLHILGLLGGWPGGLVGQRMFRHKTRKKNFRAVFWLTVVVNVGAFLALQGGLGAG
jgi:uncharacterized membrane protein YsdA (DUF1294 family)